MSTLTGFFKQHDPTADEIGGYPIPPEWWSRIYEYPWAIQYAGPGQIVADMGAGWQYRPFRDMLAAVCKKVYAVDWGTGLLDQPKPDNVEFVIDGLTKRIQAIAPGSLDRVFCISVLEELPDKLHDALVEFALCLRPGGMCIITADVVYDESKPTPYCGGIDPHKLVDAMIQAGLVVGEVDYDKTDAMYSEMLNLCVFHVIGVKL